MSKAKLPRNQCRHYDAKPAPEYGEGWLLCPCGRLYNVYKSTMTKSPQHTAHKSRAGPDDQKQTKEE